MSSSAERNQGTRSARSTHAWALAFAAWLIALASTLGALFLGEVMQVPTCVLCWYQRICMFPLVVVLPIGLLPFNRQVVRAALWLSSIGGAIAVFHLLLMAGVIPEAIHPCSQGVPCSERTIEWFGFVTVPLLSAAAFSAIIVITWLSSRPEPE